MSSRTTTRLDWFRSSIPTDISRLSLRDRSTRFDLHSKVIASFPFQVPTADNALRIISLNHSTGTDLISPSKAMRLHHASPTLIAAYGTIDAY